MNKTIYDIKVVNGEDLPSEMMKVAADIGYQTGKVEMFDCLRKAEKSATKKGIFGIIVGGVTGYFVGKHIMKKKNKEKKLENLGNIREILD
jgi:hypothetical protein